MKRNYSLDILRIFCCYCIIMLHVSGHLDTNGSFWRLVQGIVRPALWCFLMLSGYFILSRAIENWAHFYFVHLMHLLIPLIFYVFIYQLYYSHGERVSLREILAGDPIGHLWFVYSLIVLYILAPFLQQMLIHLNDIQLTSLLIVMFFFGRVVKIMSTLGWGLGIPTSIIGDCTLFFFVLGYWFYRMKMNVSYKIIIPLGIANVLYSAYTFSNPVLVDGAATLAAGMVVGAGIYFLLFSKIFANIQGGGYKKAIAFLSARTYGIYLIHMLVFQYFTGKGFMALEPHSYSNLWLLPVKCLVIFLISLVFAIIMDLVICNPLQKGIKYLADKMFLDNM